MTSIRRLGWTAFALIALVVVGCEPATPTTPPATPTTEPPKAPSETKTLPVEPKKEADASKLSEDEIAEIKKLPEDEQPIALAQMTCPVSDDHLGEMGKPIKQVVDGKTFYLCCAGCEKSVKADPAAVLAKLKK